MFRRRDRFRLGREGSWVSDNYRCGCDTGLQIRISVSIDQYSSQTSLERSLCAVDEIVKSLVEVQRITVYGVSSYIGDICITHIPTRLRDHQRRQNRKAIRDRGGNWGEKCLWK